jgi:hypothetical protein
MPEKKKIADQIIHFSTVKNPFHIKIIQSAAKIIKSRPEILCMIIDTHETDEIYEMLKGDPNVRAYDVHYQTIDNEVVEFFNEKYVCGSKVIMYSSGNILSNRKRRFIITSHESIQNLYKLSSASDELKKRFLGADCAEKIKAYLEE